MKIKVILILLLLLLTCSSVFGNGPIKIMPLGDSITQASSSHYSYRYALWKKLIDYNIDFDFVGSLDSNWNGNPEWPDYKGRSFDRDHEGHWGWRADGILAYLSDWLEGYTPDIVLLHIGTNDIGASQSYSSTADEIKQIIDTIRVKNPDVKILLAKIIPRSWTYNNIVAFNEYIEPIAQEKNLWNSPVIVVDQWTGFSHENDTYDGTHPNESGEEKMAEKWFQAILEALRTFDTDLNHDDKIDAADLAYITNNWALESYGDLYFGDNFNDVNVADTSSATYMGNFVRNSYQPDNLEPNNTYYWRIDEIDANGFRRGDVWQFTTGSGDSNIGFWKLDGETEDLCSNNDALVFGEASIKNDPNWGKCFSFDGYDDYIQVPNEPAFDLTDEITISAWIYLDTDKEDYYTIVSKGYSFWLYADKYTNGVTFVCNIFCMPLISTTNVFDGQWHHITAICDAAERALYIDGIKDVSISSTGAMELNDEYVLIGDNGQSIEDDKFEGAIRDVRIYSSRLSDDQILWLSKTDNYSPRPFNGQDNVSCDSTLIFSPQLWMNNTPADLNRDFVINFEDFSILAKDWLETIF